MEESLAGDTRFFKQHSYVVLKQVIGERDATRYASYALMNRQHPDYYLEETNRNAISRYGDALGESLLRNLQSELETVTGLSLLPTHSCLQLYANGAKPERRVAPPACEVSATLIIGGDVVEPWPIWLNNGNEEKAIDLLPGDMLVYRGCQVEHWREQLQGEFWVQLLLCYVNADGDLAHYRYDGRRGLGEQQNRKQQDRFIELRKEFDSALAAGSDRPCFCKSGQPYSACHGVLQQAIAD